jgi:hypothetical protein
VIGGRTLVMLGSSNHLGLTPMFYSYLLSASAFAAMSLGALLYTVAGPGEWKVEGAQARTGRAASHGSGESRDPHRPRDRGQASQARTVTQV